MITCLCVGVCVREKENLFTQKEEPKSFTIHYVNVNELLYTMSLQIHNMFTFKLCRSQQIRETVKTVFYNTHFCGDVRVPVCVDDLVHCSKKIKGAFK